jgi:hypothetical protein
MLSVAASSPEGFALANSWQVCEEKAQHGWTVSRDNWRVVFPLHRPNREARRDPSTARWDVQLFHKFGGDCSTVKSLDRPSTWTQAAWCLRVGLGYAR